MRVERSLASNHRFTPPRASLIADSPLITPAKSNKKARLVGGAPANDIQTCTLAGGAPAKDAKRNALAGAFSYVRDKGLDRLLRSARRLPPRSASLCFGPLAAKGSTGAFRLRSRPPGSSPFDSMRTKLKSTVGCSSVMVRDKGLTACFAPLAGYLLAALRSASDRSLRKAPPGPFAYARALRVQVPSILCAQN